MRELLASVVLAFVLAVSAQSADKDVELPGLVVQPNLFATLVNPPCSHCRDEAVRRADELQPDEPVLCWIRGKYDGGAIPFRFFLVPYRVISDTYGVFVLDTDAGFVRGFEPSLDFEFHGFYRGVMVIRNKADGTLYSALSGRALSGPKKGNSLKPVPTLSARWGHWLKMYPDTVAYHMFPKHVPLDFPTSVTAASKQSRIPIDDRLDAGKLVVGLAADERARAYAIDADPAETNLIADRFANETVLVVWNGPTKTAVTYAARTEGESPRALTFRVDKADPATPLVDNETGSRWDIAGRARSGSLKGQTLAWLPGVACRWFAWSAEYPTTDIRGPSRAAVGN